jgi:aspartyl-tRNA(Asn)/glutamyl-tRNA(Gln) amidotransferase subunit C
MATFSKEDLVRLAQLSALTFNEKELETYLEQFKQILNYVEELKNAPITMTAESVNNVNVLRDDIAIAHNTATILAQAPTADDGYFAVPKILDDK